MALMTKIPKVKKQIGWKVNLYNCIGCRACEAGCKQEFNLPVGVRRRRVITQEGGKYPKPYKYFVTTSCHHCAEPACLKACPKEAIYKREEDGIVLVDQNKCIGCQRCKFACPHGAPQYNPETKKIDKCTLCVHRLEKGLAPACVITCMGFALYHGELDKIEQEKVVDKIKNFDPSFTKPSIRFIPTKGAV